MNKTLLLALVATTFTVLNLGQDRQEKKKIYSNSYLGKVAPEFDSAKEAVWLNSKKPLSIAGLKGRVIWVEFSFIH